MDPATVMAVCSLGSTALSLGAKGDRVPMEMLQANLQATIALHARMDNVEKALGEILLSLAELRKDIQTIINNELAQQRARDTLSAITSIQERMQTIDKQTSILRDQRAVDMLGKLLLWRNTLIAGPDTNIPALIQIYIGEVGVLKAAGDLSTLRVALEVYEKRFARAQDVNEEGSLAWTRQRLLSKQAEEEEVIAQALNIPSKKIIDGDYPWLKHAEVHTRDQEYSERVCVGEYNNICYWESKTRKVDFVHHMTERARSVVIRIVDPRFDTKLVEVGIGQSNVIPEPKLTPELLKGADRHRNDKQYEEQKTNDEQNVKLLKKIDLFNERAEQIEYLSNVLALLSIIRVQNAKPDIDTLKRIQVPAQRAELQKLVDRRIATANELINVMSKTRADAWKGITESQQRIRDAIDESRRDKWRSEAILILNVVAASAQLVNAVKAHEAATALRDAGDAAERSKEQSQTDSATEAKPTQQGSPKAALKPPSSKSEQKVPDPIVRRDPNAPRNPLTMTSLEKHRRLREIKERVPRASLVPEGPAKLSERDRLNFEAITILDTMSPSAVDRYMDKQKQRPIEIIGKAAVATAAGLDPTKGAKVILKESLKPTMMGDGTWDSAPAQWLSSERAFHNHYLSQWFKENMPNNYVPNIKQMAEQSWREYELCKDNGCWKAAPR